MVKQSDRIKLLFAIMLPLTACQSPSAISWKPPIKPWERQYLSQPAMEFSASDLNLTMNDHFYFSKEGTSGGRGFAGGGCGCN